MNIILLGPPGSGKGTQGEILAKRTGITRVSTGDLLREAVEQGTTLGKRAKSYMEQGLLVPDDVIVALLREVMATPQAAKGIIMDGFPRTATQAAAVERLVAERKQRVDKVLYFNVPDEELKKRVMGRGVIGGRSDDTVEALQQRLAVYREQTAPLVAFYGERGNLVQIDAVGSITQIADCVRVGVGA
jgi:adenylate kinase